MSNRKPFTYSVVDAITDETIVSGLTWTEAKARFTLESKLREVYILEES